MKYSSWQIEEKYESAARKYATAEKIQDSLLRVGRLRREVLGKASGEVLEVAVGTGVNLPYYPEGCEVTAVDLSPAMLEIARERAGKLSLEVSLQKMNVESLEFEDQSFDTVVSSLTLCTFPDPQAALREMSRVCKVDGRILLLEHGRSNREWLGRWQDRKSERHAEQLGCHWNLEPTEIVRSSGLELQSSRRRLLGVFHAIEVQPPTASVTGNGSRDFQIGV